MHGQIPGDGCGMRARPFKTTTDKQDLGVLFYIKKAFALDHGLDQRAICVEAGRIDHNHGLIAI